ncbi:MAG TPA: hypothetical protein VIK07_03535 [Bacteroidales bacterium]
MKRKCNIILITVFLGATLGSCTKNISTADNTSLKQSINQSALNLNNAMSTISASKAYSILTVSDGISKSLSSTDAQYKVYITLDTVKGIFNYKPATKKDKWGMSLMRYFTKTADDSKMIVNMPLSKVLKPRLLREYKPADSTLTNNFMISVSDYHNNYNNYHDFDYILASEISVDNVVTGNLNIKSAISPALGINYSSQFAFAGSYTVDYKYESGDTTVSSFTITGDNKVLYEEKLLTVKTDTCRFGREHQYILTIGDVQIIRKSGTKDVSVSVNGVLQLNAVVTIVDKEADSEASVCKKRDIQITFDDGTTTTVSALIGNSVANIKTLFDSLHSVYFAAYVVDWIAYDIYYQRN